MDSSSRQKPSASSNEEAEVEAPAPPTTEAATTTAPQPPPPSLADSRLESIWLDHLAQYRRIDDLEKRIDEHASRLRRRVVNVLETTPSHRLSHLRLFVSHHDRSPASEALVSAHAAAAATTTSTDSSNSKPRKWTLAIEGKLLIDHLDHESAKAFDDRLKEEFQKRHGVSADHSSLAIATSVNTTNTSPSEEEEAIAAIKFTHFFDKVVAQFQSVYQPITEAASASGQTAGATGPSTPKASTPKASASNKKSRSAKRQKTATTSAVEVEEPAPVDPRLLTYSDPQEFTWNKTITTITNAIPAEGNKPGKPAGITTSTTTKDAHAFFIHYESPPPSAGMMLYGSIATVQLYPSRGPDQRYKPSKDFAKAFFPKHIVAIPPPVLPTTSIAEAKKADEDEQDDESATPSKYKRRAPTPPAHQTGPHALENAVHVPTSLTMKEILTSLYTYIHDHKLTAENDPTLIENDKKLQGLFQCESMRFHELQTQLMQSKLILLLPKPAPIVVKYLMKANTVIPGTSSDVQDGAAAPPEILAAPITTDLHNDVYVPNLLPSRARECLRRIKHRELDYTGSRTKARYLIMASKAKDESVVKAKLDQAICGTTIGDLDVLACLAKAAAPHSEARTVAELDAKIAFLLDQVEASQQAAQQAWDLVDLCRDMGSSDTDGDAVVVDTKEEEGEAINAPVKEKPQGNDPMDVDDSITAAGTTAAAPMTEDTAEAQI